MYYLPLNFRCRNLIMLGFRRRFLLSCFGHAPAIRILPSPDGAQTRGRGMVDFEPVQRSRLMFCDVAIFTGRHANVVSSLFQ